VVTFIEILTVSLHGELTRTSPKLLTNYEIMFGSKPKVIVTQDHPELDFLDALGTKQY
jgi:hypothetical protein